MEEEHVPTKKRKLSNGGDDAVTEEVSTSPESSSSTKAFGHVEGATSVPVEDTRSLETKEGGIVSTSSSQMTTINSDAVSSSIVGDRDVKEAKEGTDGSVNVSEGSEEEAVDDVISTHHLEKDVGITEYISQHEGFHGILKERYSDFLVNEIDPKGLIVRLTDVAVPVDHTIPPQDSSLSSVISGEKLKELQDLGESKDKKAKVIIEVGEDKEKRTAVHKAIRQLKLNLESRTDSVEEKKVIVVTCMKKKGNRIGERWPPHRPDYSHFVMYKENCDTMQAVDSLAKLMRIRSNHFTFAGTKDKRAITSQRVSIFRTENTRLYELNHVLKGIKIGNLEYNKEQIKLGDLSGNHFSIILRSVTGTDHQIEEGMKSLKEVGFINYFGMQRFGTTSTPTHHVGRCLLHSKWAEAVDLILKARTKDFADIAECLKVWSETKDPVKAIEKLKRRNSVEMHLLQGLRRFGQTDLVTALQMIPRSTRLMYVHSYQSYAWNTVVSRRIRDYGLKPIVGDLVIPGFNDIEDSRTKDELQPIIITEETLSQYTIHDIVLPLPGFSVVYPSNETREWYKELLAEDDLDIDKLKHRIRDYSLPGAYRRVIVKPSDVAWKTLRYTDPLIPLQLNDLERLQGKVEPESLEDGEQKALKLEFSLPSSTYATMALREILKADTSKSHQATLSKR